MQGDTDDQGMEIVYGVHHRRPNAISNLNNNKVNLFHPVIDGQC